MPGYATKQESVAIVGADNLIIRSLRDKQQFSDPHGEAERLGINSATWSLFGVLWRSGDHLAARMAARGLKAGERILEIGCGLALASLVGHRRGADVTASDRHPLAGAFLLHNLRVNELPPMKYRHGEWREMMHAQPDTVVQGRYELIIGSDVLYDRDASVALSGFIARHTTDTAEVWIVDPDRGNRAGFTRRMAQAGFAVQDDRLDELASVGRAAYKGRMLTYRRGN